MGLPSDLRFSKRWCATWFAVTLLMFFGSVESPLSFLACSRLACCCVSRPLSLLSPPIFSLSLRPVSEVALSQLRWFVRQRDRLHIARRKTTRLLLLHNGLLYKMIQANLPVWMCKLIKSYLRTRTDNENLIRPTLMRRNKIGSTRSLTVSTPTTSR